MSPRVDQRASPARRADQVRRSDRAAVLQHDRLALVQPAPERSLGNAQLARPLRIESAQPDVLRQRVADRVGAVLGLEDHDVVLAPDGAGRRLHLDDLDRELVALDAERDGRAEDPLAPRGGRRA